MSNTAGSFDIKLFNENDLAPFVVTSNGCKKIAVKPNKTVRRYLYSRIQFHFARDTASIKWMHTKLILNSKAMVAQPYLYNKVPPQLKTQWILLVWNVPHCLKKDHIKLMVLQHGPYLGKKAT